MKRRECRQDGKTTHINLLVEVLPDIHTHPVHPLPVIFFCCQFLFHLCGQNYTKPDTITFPKLLILRIARSDVYFGLSGGNPITNGRLPGTLPPAIPCIPPAQEYRNVRTASTHRGRHFYPAYIRNEKVPVIPGASPVLLRR